MEEEKIYNPKTGRFETEEELLKRRYGKALIKKARKKKEPPKEKKKMGRPRLPNSKNREKAIFIVKETKEVPKREYQQRFENNAMRGKKGRPKKELTEEELVAKEEKQKQRIENTIANRSKAFIQPWCGSALKFRNKVDEYFDVGANTYTLKKGDEEITQKIYTWTGLAFYLGFSSRSSLDVFGKKPEFKEIVEKAKLRVERGYEEKLHSTNPTGAIFALKNFGWIDTTKTDLSITVNPFEKLLKEAGKKQLPANITMVEDGN